MSDTGNNDKLKNYSINLFMAIIIAIVVLFAFFLYIIKDNVNYTSLYNLLLPLTMAIISGSIVSVLNQKVIGNISMDTIRNTLNDELSSLKESMKDNKSSSEELARQMQSFNDCLAEDLVVKEFKGLGLVNVYKNRKDEKTLNAMKDEIKESMKISDEIKLLGTTHRDFFFGDLARDFARYCGTEDKNIKVLLSNPFSEHIIKRTLMEQDREDEINSKKDELFSTLFFKNKYEYLKSETCTDMQKVFDKFNLTFKSCKADFEMKFYNDYPSMWLIITNDKVFFQVYQYGTDGLDDDIIMNIGECFIVMTFVHGYVYKLLSDHFDIIWEDKMNWSAVQMETYFDNIYDAEHTLLDDYIEKYR